MVHKYEGKCGVMTPLHPTQLASTGQVWYVEHVDARGGDVVLACGEKEKIERR
jgi:hypothetical protein